MATKTSPAAKERTPQDILTALSEPFAGDVVKWRAQGKPYKRGDGRFYARVVAYVDARIVIDRLNTVMGLDWQKRTSETAKGRVMCAIGITLPDGREVWRDDGAGDTQIEGEKGAISDALKRAAVNFGVGAYLYALPSPSVEVECDQNGERIALRGLTKESRQKLAALAQRSLAKWEADLKAMDVGDEDDAPAADNSSPPAPPPSPATSRKPAPKEAPQQSEPEEPKTQPVNVRSPTNLKGGRIFPPPAIATGASAEDRKDAWKVWSRGPLAAIKASSSRDEAIAQIDANRPTLAKAAKSMGGDPVAHLMAVVDKYFPEADPPRTLREGGERARRAPEDESNPDAAVIVDLPETRTRKSMDQWAAKLDNLITRVAQSPADVDRIIAANEEGAKEASALLEMDVPTHIRARWNERNNVKTRGASR